MSMWETVKSSTVRRNTRGSSSFWTMFDRRHWKIEITAAVYFPWAIFDKQSIVRSLEQSQGRRSFRRTQAQRSDCSVGGDRTSDIPQYVVDILCGIFSCGQIHSLETWHCPVGFHSSVSNSLTAQVAHANSKTRVLPPQQPICKLSTEIGPT